MCRRSDATHAKNYGSFVFFVVYVDDILLFAEYESVFQSVIVHFENHFEIKMSQRIDKFLGFSVDDDGTYIKLRSKPMVERLLTHFNMADCNPPALFWHQD